MTGYRTFGRIWQSDIIWSLRTQPAVLLAAITSLLFFLAAVLAPWIAPQNPFDIATIDLMDAFTPPAWTAQGNARFLLGADHQGRDMLSAIMYGARISLVVGLGSVAFAASLGVTLGLIAGYFGGLVDAVIMRAADVQLTFPAILVALLFDGAMRAVFGREHSEALALIVLVFAIGLSKWVEYARVVRGSVLVERNKEYVLAARLIGRGSAGILWRHILPNVLGPVLVIGTINLAIAILTEATLSFLGVGMPPTQPSLGTLIRIGNDFLMSGEWWITLFPGIALAGLIVAINVLGDWLRDILNPKLK